MMDQNNKERWNKFLDGILENSRRNNGRLNPYELLKLQKELRISKTELESFITAINIVKSEITAKKKGQSTRFYQ